MTRNNHEFLSEFDDCASLHSELTNGLSALSDIESQAQHA